VLGAEALAMLCIVKPSRRGTRLSCVNPEGRVYKGLGRRRPALPMRAHRGAPAS